MRQFPGKEADTEREREREVALFWLPTATLPLLFPQSSPHNVKRRGLAFKKDSVHHAKSEHFSCERLNLSLFFLSFLVTEGPIPPSFGLVKGKSPHLRAIYPTSPFSPLTTYPFPYRRLAPMPYSDSKMHP